MNDKNKAALEAVGEAMKRLKTEHDFLAHIVVLVVEDDDGRTALLTHHTLGKGHCRAILKQLASEGSQL